MAGARVPRVEVYREQDGTLAGWSGDRTVAVAVAYEGGEAVGSAQLLDLRGDDPALRFLMLADLVGDALVPLARALAELASEAGASALRWIAETEDITTPAVTELGAAPRSTVYRWWQLRIPAREVYLPASGVRELPGRGETFVLGWKSASCGVIAEGSLATLMCDRGGEESVGVLSGLLSTVLVKLERECPEVRRACIVVAPDDGIHTSAVVDLGFTPMRRQAIEYEIALPQPRVPRQGASGSGEDDSFR